MARDKVVDTAVDAADDAAADTAADTAVDDTRADERVEDTVEALRAAARAAVEVGRQVLDAVERALDDPATAEKLAEVVAGFSRLAEGMRPRAAGQGGTARPADGGLEHIEVS